VLLLVPLPVLLPTKLHPAVVAGERFLPKVRTDVSLEVA
jgi:hypothetical protein